MAYAWSEHPHTHTPTHASRPRTQEGGEVRPSTPMYVEGEQGPMTDAEKAEVRSRPPFVAEACLVALGPRGQRARG